MRKPDWRKREPNSIEGAAAVGEIETRYDHEGWLDEIVAQNARVHLEMMDVDSYALIIETEQQRACFWIGPKRPRPHGNQHVLTWESWKDDNRHPADDAGRGVDDHRHTDCP